MTTDTETLHAAAWAALSTVYDPELDEPVTELGFVAELAVGEAGAALVRLRLPTYFCAPNFAYIMVADAHDAVAAVPGVGPVRVRLDDHFASREINAGMAAGRGFADSFAGLADGELDELRHTFWRKAHLACQDRVSRSLLRAGRSVEDLCGLTLGEVPESADLARLRQRRRDLGLPAGPEAALVVDDSGRALDAEELPVNLRFARAARVNIEANAGFCRGLLRTRYGEPENTPDQAGETTEEGENSR